MEKSHPCFWHLSHKGNELNEKLRGGGGGGGGVQEHSESEMRFKLLYG